ncbi:MAG: hypothetical protein JNL11_02570 [Bdellovibrionaceae bacterium]|nr:hypothetical protein [Pseudobdellovibrionaceae bacterium]
MKHSALLSLFLFFFSATSWSQAWPHDANKTWNDEIEHQYSKWIENNVDDNFLRRPGRVYSGMSVDCADFVYLLRMVFAMDNGLEFAINDPSRPGQIISSRSRRWQMHPQKVRAFFQYVFDVTNTQTLPNDTVLVPLSKTGLRPGVILLGDKKRGHSMVIKNFKPSGIPILFYGNLPAREFVYTAYNFPDPLSYFPLGPISQARGGGFRWFKWPQDLSRSLSEISYAGEDQLVAGKDLVHYFDLVQKVVRVRTVVRDELVNYMIDDLCSQVRVRINTITDAAQFLKRNSYRESHWRMSAAEDDRFSTYKRDESIRGLISKIQVEYKQALQNTSYPLSTATKARLHSVFMPKGTMNDECIIDWAENRIEPLGWIIERYQSGLISSRAQDPLGVRWGMP